MVGCILSVVSCLGFLLVFVCSLWRWFRHNCIGVSRCSRWWSFNVETSSASPSDGQGKSEEVKSESSQDTSTADSATEELKTQLAEIEVYFIFLLPVAVFYT